MINEWWMPRKCTSLRENGMVKREKAVRLSFVVVCKDARKSVKVYKVVNREPKALVRKALQ